MLDSDLALLYGVTTTRLNEQVKRNLDRFPPDFMFPLTKEERGSLMSQIAISKGGRGGRRKLPYAFTEHGAVMAANVLNSPVAVRASIIVVRAFVGFFIPRQCCSFLMPIMLLPGGLLKKYLKCSQVQLSSFLTFHRSNNKSL